MLSIDNGKWKVEKEGKSTVVVSVGPLTLDLKELIIKNNKECALYNAIYQKPMDDGLIEREIVNFKKIIIYDAYGIENGFPQALLERLNNLGYKGEVVIKSIPDVFVDHASIEEQLDKFGLLPEQIIELL